MNASYVDQLEESLRRLALDLKSRQVERKIALRRAVLDAAEAEARKVEERDEELAKIRAAAEALGISLDQIPMPKRRRRASSKVDDTRT